jgi:hypothetical protein
MLFGSFPETELHAPSLGWVGRADLITVGPGLCEIVDYKTGAPSDGHLEQVHIYSLLWFRDSAANPEASLATRLVLRYAGQDTVVPSLTREELGELETVVLGRTETARSAIAGRPPEARPGWEVCDGCPVRQLCGEYWTFLHASQIVSPALAPGEIEFGDVEVSVLERKGPRSWRAVVTRGKGVQESTKVVLRAASESVVFPAERRVRILNAGIARDEDSGVLILTITSNSEAFQL